MAPPEVGPKGSPGLSGPEVHGLVHPGIPSGRLCVLFPAFLGLRYRCSRLYTTTSWEALSGYARWEGPGDPPSLDGYPDLGVVSWDGSWDGDPTWGSRPIWGGCREEGRGVGGPITCLPYIYLRARVLEVWLAIWGP